MKAGDFVHSLGKLKGYGRLFRSLVPLVMRREREPDTANGQIGNRPPQQDARSIRFSIPPDTIIR